MQSMSDGRFSKILAKIIIYSQIERQKPIFYAHVCRKHIVFSLLEKIFSSRDNFFPQEHVFLHSLMLFAGATMRIHTKMSIFAPTEYRIHPLLHPVMTDFAAIDFETANECPCSVCSVGVVIVREGVIVDRYYSLIHPEPDYYNYWNTRVHGLTFADTYRSPNFRDVWAEIEPLIEGLPLVAHNSRFDEGCLKAAFRVYQMDYPDYVFLDTLRAARRVLGKSVPNHQLHTVASYCGYNLRNHHHALADAEACAVIAMQLL